MVPRIRITAAVAVLALVFTSRSPAQDRRSEQFYYPGRFNWTFLKSYPEAARLFNAFDYGHAVLYERLLTKGTVEADTALEKEFRFLTTDLLIHPPRFAIAEEAVEPNYAKLAWRAKQMFDWAHVLHRQIYDLYADARLSPLERDALIERVTDYYLSRKDYAFTSVPKSMALMDEQYFSQGFRRAHPKFNGLIWSYHWLQVGLYEPFIAAQVPADRKAGIQATLARFWAMLEQPPSRFPTVMPMTSAVAPNFSAAHPRAAVIFDNLHMMHDIISDILVADTIPRDRKRDLIYGQLAEFRDSTRNTMSMDEWRSMGEAMGLDAMGGPALERPVRRQDSVDAADNRQAAPGQRQHQHPAAAIPADTAREQTRDGELLVDDLMQLYESIARDSVLRVRFTSDSAFRERILRLVKHAPSSHQEHLRALLPAVEPAKKPPA
jgi:hypothetical protein